MTRATRSRQAPVSPNMETVSKRSTRTAVAKKTTKEKVVSKTRSGAKNISDENSGRPTRSSRVSKSQPKTSVLGSKLHSAKKDDSLIRENTLLAMKSPVLRDRTNTTNEPVKVDASSKKADEVGSKNKKSRENAGTKATKKNDEKLSNNAQPSIEKYVVKGAKVQTGSKRRDHSEETKEEPLKKKRMVTKSDEAKAEKNSALLKETPDIEPCVDKNNDEDQELRSNKKIKAPDANVVKNRAVRRKHISMEAVEQLLNEDDEMMEVESDKEDIENDKNNEDDEKTEAVETEKVEEDKKVTKKFFKNKATEEEILPATNTRKVLRRKVNNRKKVESIDSTFSPKLEEQRQSTKPPEKKLRPRANKNYCELSKLSQSPSSNEDKPADAENVANKDPKGVPIYNNIKLSQENVKDKEEIYDFPDESQENVNQKGKKRKKTVRMPAVKRAKKAASSKPHTVQKAQKKQTKKVPCTVRFEEQNQKPINIINVSVNINNNLTQLILPEASNKIIPEHLLNAGDSTIAEASTIKILSDHKLEGSKRISLTSTPPVPKTITSELKLFGPKNVITSKPTTQYSNMVNHSLIRKSMSPIKKVAENFDIGSPWRAADAFSRVNQVVQSTPQINRLPSMREKRLPMHLANLNKKSLNSEDTIHISSIIEEKSSNKIVNSQPVSTTKENEVSPRKFGTVISNLSPAKSVNNSRSPVQNNQQSPVQLAPTASPMASPMASPDLPEDQEGAPTIPATGNKENSFPSPIKSPKKKFSTPSPFRFEKIRSSKRIASIESQSKTPKSTLQNKTEEPEPEAGPSWLDKPKPAALRQSNLNNFLNLDEVPESTRISTVHGIFDDVHSTPIIAKKPRSLVEEPNIDNAFGFDDCDVSEVEPICNKSSTSIIATEQDVKESVKGKLFPKARVKSSLMPSRISENTVKKTLLKNVLKKKKSEEEAPEVLNESSGESDSEKENDKINRDAKNNNKPESAKKSALDAVSFSDTFDVYSENGEEIESKVPKEIPLFADLEPAHFSKPPRRSYTKRKRAIYYDTSRDDFESEDEEDKPKPKKKKESKISKEEKKRMQEWLKSINQTFEEIEQYPLVVEKEAHEENR